MFSLIKKNLKIFLNKRSLTIIFPILCILMFIIFKETYEAEIDTISINNDILLSALGSNLNTFGSFKITLFLVINFYHIWYTIFNYQYDLNYSPEMLFLRISKTKWLSAKYISLLFFNIITNLIFFSLYVGFLKIFNLTILMYLIITIILKFILQILLLLFYNLFGKYGIIIIGILLLLPIFVKGTGLELLYTSYYTIDNVSILVLMFIILLILLFISTKNTINFSLKRRNNND